MLTMSKPNKPSKKPPVPSEPTRDTSKFPLWNQKVRALLKKRPDLTQSDLAREIGVGVRTVGKWMTDGNKPMGRRLAQISEDLARVFGTDAIWLMSDEMGFPAPSRLGTAPASDLSPQRPAAPEWVDPALLELLQAAATDAGAKAYLLGALDAYRQRHGPPAPRAGRGTAGDTSQP